MQVMRYTELLSRYKIDKIDNNDVIINGNLCIHISTVYAYVQVRLVS